MEDEQGDVGHGSGSGVSELPLSGNLPGETLSENTGGGDQVEGSYEKGDGREIMVEVVGSDVLVDGVSGHKGSDVGLREAGNLEGHVWENTEEPAVTLKVLEAVDTSTEADGNDMGEGHLESSDVKSCVVADEENVSFREPVYVDGGAVCALPLEGVGISGDEACNTGSDAISVSSSAEMEFLPVQTEEIIEKTPFKISEEKTDKDESVNDSAEYVKPEPLNHPVEAVVDGEVSITGKEEVLPSNDNATSHHMGTYSEASHETAGHGGQVASSKVPLNPSHECPENVHVDRSNSVVGEVRLVDTCARQDISAINSSKDGSFRANGENASTDVACGPEVKLVDGKEVLTAESKDLILNSDTLVSSVLDKNRGCLNEFQGTSFESNHGSDGVSHGSPASLDKKSVSCECLETVGVEFDDLHNFNDGASDINPPDLSSVGYDECLKMDKTGILHQNHASATQLADEGHAAAVNKEKGLNVVIKGNSKENKTNLTLNCPVDDEIVQVDSRFDENRHFISTPVSKVIDDQNVAISEVAVVDEDGSSEKGNKLDSEMPTLPLECQGKAEISKVDPSTGKVDFSAKGACAEVETADVTGTHDCSTNIPVVNSQAVFDNVFSDSGLCPNKEQQVSVQITETPNYGIEKVESINLMPKEIASIALVSDITQMCILPEITETAELPLSDIKENSECDVANFSDKVNIFREADDSSGKTNGLCFQEVQNSEAKVMGLEEESDSDKTYHGGMAELGTEEPASETGKLNLSHEETTKSVGSLRMNQSGYLSSPEGEGHFSISDLVWGKVRSHPWWPGQIFNPADASEKAVKYYKKDAYLIAYFGDQTFAWNDSSVLKPFRSHFSQIEKQSNSEAFQNAVNCALEEVSRRIKLGLACSCIPKDAFCEIESQVVENTGIREESSRRYGVDWSSQATYFEPEKLLEYVKGLAPHTSSVVDRMDLVIARAQLSAFYRFKGYRPPTGFPSSEELLENDADTEQISDEAVASMKHEHTTKDYLQSRKERSFSELMGERESPDDEPAAEGLGKLVSLSSGVKRKPLDPLVDGSDKRVTTNAAKSSSMNQTPKPSFKIGECIRRVASQLTGSTSLVKGNNDGTAIDGSPKVYDHSEGGSVIFPAESFSLNEVLLQLQLLALDPKKGQNFQNSLHAFFLGFRSSIALNRRGRKKKTDPTVSGSGEEFEFDDVNDSYWTDRIVQNYSEEQLLNNSENGAALQVVPFVAERSAKQGRKSRKRFSSMNYPADTTDIDENAKRRKQETSPAELILNFAERNCLPSEINLNKTFRRFGPLMESETEVDHESGCAKVIFKRGSDAEVACESSEKFKIFGPVLVNYQIGYSPVISVKISPLAIPQIQEDVTLLL